MDPTDSRSAAALHAAGNRPAAEVFAERDTASRGRCDEGRALAESAPLSLDNILTLLECLSWCPTSVEQRGRQALMRALARKEREDNEQEENPIHRVVRLEDELAVARQAMIDARTTGGV